MVVEMKLGEDFWGPGQRKAYTKIAGGRGKLVEMTDDNCQCEGEKEKVPQKESIPEVRPVDILLLLAALALLLTPIPGDEALVSGTAAASLLKAF